MAAVSPAPNLYGDSGDAEDDHMVVGVMIMLGTSDKADDKMVLPPEERATDGLCAEQSSTPNLYGDGDDSKFTQLN